MLSSDYKSTSMSDFGLLKRALQMILLKVQYINDDVVTSHPIAPKVELNQDTLHLYLQT